MADGRRRALLQPGEPCRADARLCRPSASWWMRPSPASHRRKPRCRSAPPPARSGGAPDGCSYGTTVLDGQPGAVVAGAPALSSVVAELSRADPHDAQEEMNKLARVLAFVPSA